MAKKDDIKTASVLAFERNFDISDAVFSQTNSTGEIRIVSLKEKSVRGTISNRLKNNIASDPLKLDAEIQKPNLQKVDVAMLDHEHDTLIVEWTCKVLPFTGKPCVCNDLAYQEKLQQTIQTYINEQGFTELARRYATNILNGRWLWRNRLGAETVEISIYRPETGDQQQKGTLVKPLIQVDNAKDIGLNSFDNHGKPVIDLANLIADGLSGKQFVIFHVKAKLTVGHGQEVYPSQELILDTGNTKSKVLYHNQGQAAMHSQKISNAIRTIDTWYAEDAQFPIAIEPYGAVTTMGHAFRQPKQKTDFYNLFDNWVLKDERPAVNDQHYVAAVLIRGGVFGASGKE